MENGPYNVTILREVIVQENRVLCQGSVCIDVTGTVTCK